MFQEDTACTMLECCRDLHKLMSTKSLPSEDVGPIPFFFGKPVVSPCHLVISAPHKSGGRRVKSWPDHTHKQTSLVIWICDLCHKQINKKQTSIRFNHTHTHNTHWVHLNCTHIKQRQYKPDWRCTIHTPTQNVTPTPSTDNTTPHHKQPTPTHLQTTINQRTKTSSYFKST